MTPYFSMVHALLNFALQAITFAALALAPVAEQASAAGRFGVIVLPLNRPRQVTPRQNIAQNTITIEFTETSPLELKDILERANDERFIKNTLITSTGPQTTELELRLKDPGIRVTVDTLQEPFRVQISFFDKDYSPDIDPQTNLPLANIGESPEQTPTSSEARRPELAAAPAPLAAAGGLAVASEAGSGTLRKLLQPTPDLVTNPTELADLMNRTGAGRGKAWLQYPVYVYPLQTAAYQGRKEPAGWEKKASEKAISSGQAMADYALKLFSFGDESRALVAYQQVLYTDSSVFNKDPIHLWAFAESHLGQHNLTLADGYFQTLAEKFPESPLAQYASIRRLDIQAIQANESGGTAKLPNLLPLLDAIPAKTNGEVSALVGIRRAFWSGSELTNPIPFLLAENQQALLASLPLVESQRTALVTSSLVLNTMLRADTAWTTQTGQFAGEYFKRYNETSAQPFFPSLKRDLDAKLSKTLVKTAAEEKYATAVSIYEALPDNLQKVKEVQAVAWALGEANRNIGRERIALDFYKIAAKKAEQAPERFKANFWVAVLASRVADLATTEKAGLSTIDGLRRDARGADQIMKKAWAQLKESEQLQLQSAYKEHFETALREPNQLETPARIVLASWTRVLSTETASATTGTPNEWHQLFSPSGATVRLLRDLAQRFQNLGLGEQRRSAIALMKGIKPDGLQSDKEAQRIWSKELLDLAEEYRKDNEYLEAGRLYAFTAQNAGNEEKRAESLYKGGLLLYRSGKREEAVQAFTAASQDGNNIFYANLAKERLTQLLP